MAQNIFERLEKCYQNNRGLELQPIHVREIYEAFISMAADRDGMRNIANAIADLYRNSIEDQDEHAVDQPSEVS